ncbi:PREDICTED: biorientation of chromosomes in cell division protein 1-like 1 [Tinamus guttatus]|uniref:biorientation of chromosomes in cell division protein 1-like 1 n=1 Tax=Tinamus guttatus TaxID=94827 RepID=UPI00052F15B0|nr:PREDICTED: biorientation of chromosomes in cell division protein 1-like 1 [Tinamus guttatus]
MREIRMNELVPGNGNFSIYGFILHGPRCPASALTRPSGPAHPACAHPAYQNLRQRVDNFVSNHLATHTWSPHLNKNQLRNNIRQQVLKSGMLESGIDRIISQVVDPKINHTFRPQVEKAVHEFLATLNHKEEAGPSTASSEEKADASITVQGVPTTAPSGNVASDAMSILETITSLNQEASSARASMENLNSKTNDKVVRRLLTQQSVDGSTERDRSGEDLPDREKAICDLSGEGAETFEKCEDLNELPCQSEEIKNAAKDSNSVTSTSKEIQQESEDQKNKLVDKCDRKPDSIEKGERRKEKKEKLEKKSDHSKKSDDTTKPKEEKQGRESEPLKQLVPEKNSNKHKTTESTKEDHTLIDSDMDVLSDITVSSVHTSDLSSFEEESEEEAAVSESTEEGEITSDDEEEKNSRSKTKSQASELGDGRAKPVRHAYVHKPFLYSKYFSDSDDERTVEQRRQCIAKEKEERLLRRQINRERLEEKRKQKAAEKTKSLKTGSQNAKGKSGLNLEEPSARSLESKATGTSIKDVLKEQKFLEKKVFLSRKRKRDSRHVEDSGKKKYEPSEDDSKDTQKTNEACEKNSLKEVKHNQGKNEISKPLRRLSESVHSAEENKTDSKMEKEHKRKTSTHLQVEGNQQDSEIKDSKKQVDKADVNTEELQKQKSVFKNEKHPKKDSDAEIQHVKNAAKKEAKSYRDKSEKERTASEDKLSLKHKYKGDSVHKSSEEVELHSSERGLKGEDGAQKHNQQIKLSSDDKSERKIKHRSERKISVSEKDGKNISEYTLKAEELLRKENKKDRHLSTEKSRAEHKSKRSLSDSRPQKDSTSASKQTASASHRRSESYSEDKHEVESPNSDCNLKQADNVHKDRRRSRSVVEDKFLLKSKSKSHSKQSKASETEVQENLTKQDMVQKLDKDKSIEENNSEKQNKSKNEDKHSEESGGVFEFESGMQSTQGSQKDFSHRVKLHSGERGSVKEKSRSDKDSSNSKLERRLSETHKSRSLKHSNKEIKKKEDNGKLEDKNIRKTDSSHEKMLGTVMAMDKKSSKKMLCENRKGSISNQYVQAGEEKQSVGTTTTSRTPALQRSSTNSDASYSAHEGQPMELDLEQTKIQGIPKIEGKRVQNSLQATDAENTTKEKVSLSVSNKKLKCSLADLDTCESQLLAAVEKTAKQESIPNKDIGALDSLSKQTSMDQGPSKQGAYQMSIVYETSGRILLNAPNTDQSSEDSKKPKNSKTVINPNVDNEPLAINSSRQDAADVKTVVTDIANFTDSSGGTSKEERPNSDGTSLNKGAFTLKNDAAQTAYMEQGSASVSYFVKDDGNNAVTDSIQKDSEVPLPDKQAMKSKANLCVQDYDKATKLESFQRSEFKIKDESLTTDITEACEDATTKELAPRNLKRKEGECLNTDPSTKGERGRIIDNVKSNEVCDIADTIQSSSVLVRVPEEADKDSVIASREEESGVTGMEDKNESSAVGSSAGSSKLSLLHSSLRTTATTMIGTSTETIESTVIATSTGEGRSEGASRSEKESDATTTCSEEESEVTLICTSIEADEGFTTGIWVKSSEGGDFVTGANGECTVAAAEEGGSGVVTAGLAESEGFLTSTKEENDEYNMVDTEESSKDSVNASGVEAEDSVNSAGVEEKDDAVTSAGSEEKRKTSTSGDVGKLESSVSCLGEVESDGAVTSAGTETGEGSTSGDNLGEFSSSVVRGGQVKEHEGTVTCTGAEERSHNFIICSVTGTDAQGESTVTGACIEVDTNNSATSGTSSDKCEDPINGESAVTSTGITPEDDAEVSVVCTGLEDSNEGFAVCLDVEKCESLMDSTRAKEETSITVVSVGPCDDEDFVTSTGSKEEDEEGEDIVTSTGRGNEETEHASTCTGMESESTVLCLGAEEGESSIICIVAEQMEAESGVAGTNINKLSVDSMTGVEKESNRGTNCKNAKGIVESSVTSASTAAEGAPTAHAGEHEDTLIPADAEECEGPMTGAMTVQDKSQAGTAAELENAMVSFDSRELDGSISSAVPKEDENSLTSADKEEENKGDDISTSTVEESDAPLHSAMDAEEGPLTVARTNESGESSVVLIDPEGTEMPMPSTATEFKESVHASSSKQEKDECTMISTSIVEEIETPMSSATVEYDGQLPSMRSEEINEDSMVSIDMEIYEVPMPSASSAGGDDDDESHPTASGKEEKDECAMISTSVVEEQVILMSGEVTEEAVQLVSDTESKNETVMISTSTAECFEAPMSSVGVQDENKLTASETERRYEAAMITTSMTEECEIVLISAAPQAERELVVAGGDDEALLSANASEEHKVVETNKTADEQSELAAFNTDGKSKRIFVGECGAPVLGDPTNSEDQHTASSVGEREEGAVIALSTMEECDSLFTFAVIEESQLAAESTEVKEKSEETFNTANQIECILSTAGPEKSKNSLFVIGRENETSESIVGGVSLTSQTTVDSEITETNENSVNLLSVDEALCVEVSTETAASPSPSTEANEDDEEAEAHVSHEDVASELPCVISEAATENEAVRNTDYEFNSNLLLESDFSEIRTPQPRAQAVSLVSANATATVNTSHSEVTLEAELREKSDTPVLGGEELYENDGKMNLVKIDDVGIEVTFQKSKTTSNSGSNAASPNLAEELDLETNLRTEESQQPGSPRSEEVYVDLHTEEFQKGLQQRSISLEKEAVCVDQKITEEHKSREMKSKSSGTVDKEKCNQLIAQDARNGEEQNWHSKTKANNIKEAILGDTAEVTQESDVKCTPPKSDVEEKDEFVIKQEMSEKAKQNPESNASSVEENQPIVVKRKRGRPRKYPLEAVSGGGESKADMSTGNQQSPTSVSRGKIPQTGKQSYGLWRASWLHSAWFLSAADRTDKDFYLNCTADRAGCQTSKVFESKEPSNTKETNEEEAGKAEMVVRKRGRKPKRSVAQSEETETQEPERKRRKLTSGEEEIKEQEEGEEEDGEEDDETCSGATTRSVTRLETQRKQPSKPTTRAASKGSSPNSASPRKQQKLAGKKRSPSDTKMNKSPPLTQLKMQSTKRKGEGSPTLVRRKGQPKTEEVPIKKAKR